MDKNKLSKDDIITLYNYLYRYEMDLKTLAGSFDIENKNLQSFMKEQNICLASLNKDGRKKSEILTWIHPLRTKIGQ